MARGPQEKKIVSRGDTSQRGKFVAAAIGMVSPDGTVQDVDIQEFLLNPSTWDDSKSANWAAHNIPGQSSPIYQWVSGGERIVSFQALVTKDTSDYPKNINNDPKNNILGKAINIAGNIASKFFNANIPPLGDVLGAFGVPSGNQLDISNYLIWYRNLQYPTYSGGELQTSPPLLVLYVGKSLSGTPAVGSDTAEQQYYILLDLKITITKQLPNLSPMEALVDFKLAEYNVKSRFNTDLGLDFSSPYAQTFAPKIIG